MAVIDKMERRLLVCCSRGEMFAGLRRRDGHSLPWEEGTHRSLLVTIMSMNNLVNKVARSLKKKFGSLLRPSQPPVPSPIDVDSRSDSDIAATQAGTR